MSMYPIRCAISAPGDVIAGAKAESARVIPRNPASAAEIPKTTHLICCR
jgi:hypothetical protein